MFRGLRHEDFLPLWLVKPHNTCIIPRDLIGFGGAYMDLTVSMLKENILMAMVLHLKHSKMRRWRYATCK